MITAIAILVVLAIVGFLWSIADNSRRARESQERVEKDIIAQKKAQQPGTIAGYPAAAVEAIRRHDVITAIKEIRGATGLDLHAAKAQADEIQSLVAAGKV